MRTGILLFLAVLSLSVSGMLLTGCSSTSVKRVDVDETIDLSGQWNDTDSRLVAEEMIGDVLSRTWVQDFTGCCPNRFYRAVFSSMTHALSTNMGA
ncbi:FIG00545237: hypothetical protein [Olavius algarvensis associated proteobacterium Delta 3]|nr:FIG00545237: hypothetical protein [Olavius algarvensis associated proteobacterium Delta 3]